MAELLAALGVFLLSHMIPMRPRFRRPLEQQLGTAGFLLAYSLVSLGIIYWLSLAFAGAPYMPLWPWAEWAAWLPVVLMPLACVFMVAGLTSPNPFSLGPGARGFDAEHPGIVSLTRHPLMWGLALWAGSHIPANGDVAGLLLFGLLFLLSLGGTGTLEAARRRRYPAPDWQRWRAGTSNLPFAGQRGIDWRGIGWVRLAAGLALYLLLLYGHQAVIGVAPPVFY